MQSDVSGMLEFDVYFNEEFCIGQKHGEDYNLLEILLHCISGHALVRRV